MAICSFKQVFGDGGNDPSRIQLFSIIKDVKGATLKGDVTLIV
jgi:hypothetical protein